jgi:hypothetical protein
VKEVFIPNNRNKYGKKFGLVRFERKIKHKELEVKLDNVFVGQMKLHVNLSRFNRDKVDMTGNEQGHHRVAGNERHVEATKVRRGISFA